MSWLNKLSVLFLFLTLGASSGWANPTGAGIYIDITRVSERPFPMAILPPVQDGGAIAQARMGEKFAEIVKKDLELMGYFRFVDRKAFLGDPTKRIRNTTDVDFPSWALLDAYALAAGWYQTTETEITLEVRLFDILAGKQILAKRYRARHDQLSWIAHRFSNAVFEILTGEPGIFETQIAFVCRRGRLVKELCIIDFNGSNFRQLTDDRSIVLSPTWSEDGKSIYYTALNNKKKEWQLYRYDLASASSRPITRFRGATIGLAFDPVSHLLATTLTKDGNSEIYLLNLDGTARKRLTRNRDIDVSPSFSPDGEEMVFVTDRIGSTQIFKMSRSGVNPARLTFKGLNNTSPVWSPRGDQIAFAGMDTDGHFDIFSMNSDGSGMTRLTYDTRNNEEPTWSPGGLLVGFASNRRGRYQLFSMRPDGSKQTQLTAGGFDHLMPAWGPRSR